MRLILQAYFHRVRFITCIRIICTHAACAHTPRACALRAATLPLHYATIRINTIGLLRMIYHCDATARAPLHTLTRTASHNSITSLRTGFPFSFNTHFTGSPAGRTAPRSFTSTRASRRCVLNSSLPRTPDLRLVVQSRAAVRCYLPSMPGWFGSVLPRASSPYRAARLRRVESTLPSGEYTAYSPRTSHCAGSISRDLCACTHYTSRYHAEYLTRRGVAFCCVPHPYTTPDVL